MQKGNNELDAYENIIHNLQALTEEAAETRSKEGEAIQAILQTLTALRDCVCNPDEFLASFNHDYVAAVASWRNSVSINNII